MLSQRSIVYQKVVHFSLKSLTDGSAVYHCKGMLLVIISCAYMSYVGSCKIARRLGQVCMKQCYGKKVSLRKKKTKMRCLQDVMFA